MTAAGLVLGPAAVKDPKSLDGRLDRLLAVYEKYGLPLPPPGAPLVRYRMGGAEKEGPRYGLAFQLAPAKGDRPALILSGTDDPEPAPPGAPVEVVEMPDPARFGNDNWFTDVAFAVQCHARGWHPLAREALTRYLAEPDLITPEELVHYHGWGYWTGKISKPGTDRALIARRLKVVLATRPDPAEEYELYLIRSLELALVPGQAKPGSIDALIDDLLEVTTVGNPADRSDADPRYRKLAMLGFDAVPALIAHLDDERLTRAWQMGGKATVHYYQVSDFARDLLRGLSGGAIQTDPRTARFDQAAAEKWWGEARKVGEEAYLTRHVLTDNTDAEWPNDLMLELLKEKYPARLPGVYRRLLDVRPKMASWSVARAVSASALPHDVRQKLLLDGARRANLNHRAGALEFLRPFDPGSYDRFLREALEAFPKTPAGEYWRCTEAWFVRLGTKTTNPEVWAALTKAARRADPGLRLELLDGVVVGEELPANIRKQALKYLAGFLNDDTVRDTSTAPDKFSGPCAGFHYSRLEVRDFAAMKLTQLLKLKTKPEVDWAPADWARLRTEVREALSRDGVR
jgi:hypothetical protein